MNWMGQVGQGMVFLPYPNAAAAPVHEADVAAVAVRALIDDRHVGSKPVVTGPESLTQADQVEVISDVLGRPLSVVEVPAEAARAQMAQVMPEPVADALLAAWRDAQGQPAEVTSAVRDITGRAPKSFRQWVTDHKEAFTQ